MAFVCEKIIEERDINYLREKGFTSITGTPISGSRWCAIDRERDIILISRGGGGLEMPKGFALYINGEIIEIEGDEDWEGDKFDNNLKVHWHIDKICAGKAWFEKNYDIEELMNIIKEAFVIFGYRGCKTTQVLEVTVEINARLEKR